MRRCHILKPNRGLEMPHCAVWFDTETQPLPVGPGEIKHVLRFGWGAYRRRLRRGVWSQPQWHRFTTPGKFWDWIEGLRGGRSRLYSFCHNAAFDLPVVDCFAELPARGWKLNRAVIDSPPVILGWRKPPRSILCLDTLNIWRLPLSVLGDHLGLKKLPMPDPNASRAEWDTYCRRDVEVIMAMCLQWWALLTQQDLGGFAPTLAAQALRTYRHRFMDYPILIDDDATALTLARDAYHGGRVECFRLGTLTGPLYQVDVNSMYPYVMTQQDFPVRLISTTRRVARQELRRWCNDRCVVAEVDLVTAEPAYSVLLQDKLVFPIGRFRVALTTPELVRALDRGEVRRIYQVAVYAKAPLFKTFITTLYGLRQAAQTAGDACLAWQYKILMNSLYGKFGQRGRVYETVLEVDDLGIRVWQDYDVVTGRIRKLRQFAGIIQEQFEEGESRESHPAIAAHVTAYARLFLWRLITVAGCDHVFYCDTDSLIVDQTGYANLAPWLDATTLGKLKLERRLDSVTFYGAKDYSIEGKLKCKGIKKSARQLSENCFEQEHWTTLLGLVRLGDLSAPHTRTLTKTLQRIYTKGQVLPSGQVLPLTLPL